MTAVERFWYYANASEGDGCWLWQGTKMTVGYGMLPLGGGPKVYAHRFAYELLVAPIPRGLHIDHLCRVRLCVNPSHLEPVTMAENKRRGMSANAINARKSHCQRGHEFTPENTRVSPLGHRECRTCRVTILRPRAEAKRKQA